MRASIVLQWRNLIRAVHPPLPKTPLETKKIIAALQVEMREEAQKRFDPAATSATQKYLENVLKHPMFKPASKQVQQSVSPAAPQVSQRLPLQDALWQFNDAVSKGRDSVTFVNQLLFGVFKSTDMTSTTKDAQAGRKELGNLLCSWLFQHGMDREPGTLTDRRTAFLIFQTLVATDRRNVIERWLDLAMDKMQKHSEKIGPVKIYSRLLYTYISAEAKHGAGPDAALQIFLQKLNAYYKSKGNSIRTAAMIFELPANYLMRFLHTKLEAGQVEPELYDRLSISAPRWCNSDSQERAWLALHHPTNQDPQPTYDFIEYLLGEVERKTVKAEHLMAPHRKAATVHVALRAAELFAERDDYRKALWLVNALSNHFADVLGGENHGAIEKRTYKEAKVQSMVADLKNALELENLALG